MTYDRVLQVEGHHIGQQVWGDSPASLQTPSDNSSGAQKVANRLESPCPPPSAPNP